MKKIAVLLVALCVFNQSMSGQAKQRKELILQIGALQVYIDYAKKGYSAVSKGLNFIGDARKGELNLHGDYFASLLKINPKVRNYYKTVEIISMQFKIMKLCRKTLADLKTADLFHSNELDYIERSFEKKTQCHLLLYSNLPSCSTGCAIFRHQRLSGDGNGGRI